MRYFILAVFVLAMIGISADAGRGQSTDIPLSPTQVAAMNEAKQLNLELIDLYQKQKFDEALKIGARIQELIAKNDLSADQRALVMLGNAGEVLLAKHKNAEASALFQNILLGLQRKLGESNGPAAEALDRFTRAYFNRGDYLDAEEYCLKLIAMREKLLGANSAKVVEADLFLANLYSEEKRPELADVTYLKAIAINDRTLGTEEQPDRADLQKYRCFLFGEVYRTGGSDAAEARIRQFADSRKTSTGALTNAGVLNGRATKLPKPEVSPIAGAGHITGFVVEVKIDELGKVYEAKAICGNSFYFATSKSAAMKAEFSPTSIQGKPVRVTGTIVYNFAVK